RPTALFVDGIGAAAATSGVLNQLQGRIFALLYMEGRTLSLDEIAAELEQSKSNVSVHVRGLIEWHLVRRVAVGGSRKDHYEAATDFWRVMKEIMERRFRWNLRHVPSIDETTRALGESTRPGGRAAAPGRALRRARLHLSLLGRRGRRLRGARVALRERPLRRPAWPGARPGRGRARGVDRAGRRRRGADDRHLRRLRRNAVQRRR